MCVQVLSHKDVYKNTHKRERAAHWELLLALNWGVKEQKAHKDMLSYIWKRKYTSSLLSREDIRCIFKVHLYLCFGKLNKSVWETPHYWGMQIMYHQSMHTINLFCFLLFPNLFISVYWFKQEDNSIATRSHRAGRRHSGTLSWMLTHCSSLCWRYMTWMYTPSFMEIHWVVTEVIHLKPQMSI